MCTRFYDSSDNLNHDNDSSDPINTDTTDTSLTLGDPSDADGDTDGEILSR